MNFVSRLKDYLNAKSISITQFADTCEIPRPTMSQLLNGRNKKVSDELIRKIHLAYPDVSVLWLMFGEGPMLANGQKPLETPSKSPRNEPVVSVAPEQGAAPASIAFEIPRDVDQDPMLFEEIEHDETSSDETGESSEDAEEGASTSISFAQQPGKQIVSIIVYYNDNSYESFGPILK